MSDESEKQQDDMFGLCPKCGSYDAILNVEADHWAVCDGCRTTWHIGTNMLSSWREEDGAVWSENAAKINDYEEVESVHRDFMGRLTDPERQYYVMPGVGIVPSDLTETEQAVLNGKANRPEVKEEILRSAQARPDYSVLKALNSDVVKEAATRIGDELLADHTDGMSRAELYATVAWVNWLVVKQATNGEDTEVPAALWENFAWEIIQNLTDTLKANDPDHTDDGTLQESQ